MNKGLDDASKSNLTLDPEALVLLPATDGQYSWIPVGAAHDPKMVVYDDEDLSWEEFTEAAPWMINSMKDNSWPNACIDMHIKFWSALQTHCWCHARDKTKQRVLLVYQGTQRKRWHLAIAGPNSYSLANINQELLDEMKEDLLDQSRNHTALAVTQVRFSPQTNSLQAQLCLYLYLFHPLIVPSVFPLPHVGQSRAFAPMRVNHVPSHLCRSITYPRTVFNAGQSRTLALTSAITQPTFVYQETVEGPRHSSRIQPHLSATLVPHSLSSQMNVPNDFHPMPPKATTLDTL